MKNFIDHDLLCRCKIKRQLLPESIERCNFQHQWFSFLFLYTLTQPHKTQLMRKQFFKYHALLCRMLALPEQLERCLRRWMMQQLQGLLQFWKIVFLQQLIGNIFFKPLSIKPVQHLVYQASQQRLMDTFCFRVYRCHCILDFGCLLFKQTAVFRMHHFNTMIIKTGFAITTHTHPPGQVGLLRCIEIEKSQQQ